MRRLDLHASALNDFEYNLFTTSLNDLALSDDAGHPPKTDEDYERITIGAREVRAWLRGRYPNIPVATIDSVLKLFCPELSAADILTGGQFFAALRLVVHVDAGKEFDRSLAFVQAHPSPSPTQSKPEPPKPVRRSTDVPTDASSKNPFSQVDQPTQMKPNNPFKDRSQSFLSSARSQDSHHKLPPLPPRKPPPPVPPTSASTMQPPPRHASLFTSTTTSITLTPSKSAPAGRTAFAASSFLKPAHVTSTLMKQSLQASKTGLSMKKAEEDLQKERVLQVLKSTSGPPPPPPAPRNRSTSPSKKGSTISSSSSHTSRKGDAPPLPARRQSRPSPPPSASSLEQVALAGRRQVEDDSPFDTPTTDFPQGSPTRALSDLPKGPPPRHPDQRSPFVNPSPSPHRRAPSLSHLTPTKSTPLPYDSNFSNNRPTDSPNARVGRSKSLHHSPNSDAPPPPVRKRRPESIQVLKSPSAALFDHHEESQQPGSNNSSPLMSNFQRTLATFQPKLDALQPKLDKARYKTEAGLSRRGFVRGGSFKYDTNEEQEQEGLVDTSDPDNNRSVFGDEFAIDDSDEERRAKARLPQDNLKWPPEDHGWRPL